MVQHKYNHGGCGRATVEPWYIYHGTNTVQPWYDSAVYGTMVGFVVELL